MKRVMKHTSGAEHIGTYFGEAFLTYTPRTAICSMSTLTRSFAGLRLSDVACRCRGCFGDALFAALTRASVHRSLPWVDSKRRIMIPCP